MHILQDEKYPRPDSGLVRSTLRGRLQTQTGLFQTSYEIVGAVKGRPFDHGHAVVTFDRPQRGVD